MSVLQPRGVGICGASETDRRPYRVWDMLSAAILAATVGGRAGPVAPVACASGGVLRTAKRWEGLCSDPRAFGAPPDAPRPSTGATPFPPSGSQSLGSSLPLPLKRSASAHPAANMSLPTLARRYGAAHAPAPITVQTILDLNLVNPPRADPFAYLLIALHDELYDGGEQLRIAGKVFTGILSL